MSDIPQGALNPPVAPSRILPRHSDSQLADLGEDAWPPDAASSRGRFPRDQLAVPPQNRIRGYERRHPLQQRTPERMAAARQPTPLVIGQLQAPAPELFLEDTVLLAEILNHFPVGDDSPNRPEPPAGSASERDRPYAESICSRSSRRVLGPRPSFRIVRGIQLASSVRIKYRVCDAADLAAVFAARSFDMATSCLALQDMPDPPRALRAVASVLAAGGRFVASIEHPCSNPPFRKWERDESSAKRWLCIDRYFDRGPRSYTSTRWPSTFTTTANHATLEDWFAWIRDAGFQILAVRQPRPTEAAIATRPSLADACRVPYFLIFDLIVC